MDKGHAITVENLSKTFNIPEDRKTTLKSLVASMFNQGRSRRFKALDDINLDIEKGDFVGIVGRNGSGKSTLLKLIAGIYTPDKGGKVRIHGRLVPFLELGVGFNPDLSGRENIFLNGTILGMTHEYLETKFDEIVNFAELGEFIDLPVKNYSSGMMVKLAFSIAIQVDADIYILDEILSVGDEAFQGKSISVIQRLKKQGKTIVYVSHNMDSILRYCNKAVLIHEHKIHEQGSPAMVIDTYRRIMNAGTQPVEQIEVEDDTSKDRWGNQDAIISNVRITNSSKSTNYFNQGDYIQVQFEYELKRKVDNFAIGILVHSSDDIYINGTNIDFDPNHPWTLAAGKYSRTFKFPAKFLLSGIYRLSLGAYDMDNITALDHHNKIYKFQVNNNCGDQGLVHLPFEWVK